MASFVPDAPIALITGANRSLGLGFARELKNLGYNVIGTSRSVSDKDVAELRKVAYVVVQLDTSSEQSINGLMEQLQKHNISHIDLLVNNAGIYGFESLDGVTTERMLKEFTINAIGPVLVTRALLPLLRASVKRGKHPTKVAQVSSTMGSIAKTTADGFVPGASYAYRASKAALNILTKNMSVELHKDGISLFCLCPGYVQTEGTGGQGHYTVEQSTGKLAKIIKDASMDTTGKFIYVEGEEIPW
ncbi:hypothetical protein RI367_001484 [Sorochytrium milnesiophthora]